MSISQKHRLFSFDSPLGPDKLLLNSFRGTEQLSEIYQFELELVSEDFTLTWDQIVDRNVNVGIRYRETMDYRYFNGYISKFEPIRHPGRLAYYKAEMVPWTWYLTLTSDQLIYQEMTVVEVIEKTFQKYGFTDYDVSSLGDRHAKWINCCQYQETAFHFVSRLMEIEGIYYYFKQEQGKHTMILVDHLSAHEPCPYQSTMTLEHETGEVTRDTDTIFESNMAKAIRPNKYAHKDYNFLIPSHQLYYDAPMGQFMGSSRTLEIYDYPGDIDWEKDSPDWAALRQEELELDRVQVAGKSNCRAMIPGYRFDLTNHDRPEQDLNYLIVKVTHSAHEGSFTSADSATATYENSFTTIPSTVQFRPKCKTETPNIGSIQTAHVVGPEGEEIYTDEYGRVKVHFHWDRTKPSEDSSCWIRVMQPIAGPGFGHIWLPRVGQEVIVQFVEGDPDRPVITGCLYNHVNHPPYNLPDYKNWSGVKTRSTKDGDATQFNELRFVDTKGDELYAMHAQKNLQITVENDTIEVIDRDRTMQVKRDHTEAVGRNRSTTVKGDSSTDIQGQMSINAQQDVHEKAAGMFVLQAGGDIHLKAGGRIVLEAAEGITFLSASGASFIDCAANGITIQGPKVWVNCGLPLPMGAISATPILPGLPSLPSPLNLNMISNLPDLSNLTSAASNLANSVTNAVSQAVSSVTNAVSQTVSSVADTVNQAVSSVTNVANQEISSVTQAASSMTNAVNQEVSSVTQAASSATNAANQAVSSAEQTVQSVAGAPAQALSSIGQLTANPKALASNPWVVQDSALTSPGSLPPTIEQIEGEES